MKKVYIIFLVFLVLAPPLRAHYDVVVYEDVFEHLETENIHNVAQHKNENKEDEKKEHHHHCTVINFELTFISVDNNFKFIEISSNKNEINFYQKTNYSTYLDGVFQPPRV